MRRLKYLHGGFCDPAFEKPIVFETASHIGIHFFIDTGNGTAINEIVFPEQFAHSFETENTWFHLFDGDSLFKMRQFFASGQNGIGRCFQYLCKVDQNRNIRKRFASFLFADGLIGNMQPISDFGLR